MEVALHTLCMQLPYLPYLTNLTLVKYESPRGSREWHLQFSGKEMRGDMVLDKKEDRNEREMGDGRWEMGDGRR